MKQKWQRVAVAHSTKQLEKFFISPLEITYNYKKVLYLTIGLHRPQIKMVSPATIILIIKIILKAIKLISVVTVRKNRFHIPEN